NSGGHPHHFQGRRRHSQDVQSSCQLLHHQAGRPGTVHHRGEIYRGLLVGDRPVAIEREEMSKPRVKVLLVEDNPADARLIQESLAEASDDSFDLELADTLAAGLKRLSSGGIDAMLLDLALPDSSGQETFVRAKAQ